MRPALAKFLTTVFTSVQVHGLPGPLGDTVWSAPWTMAYLVPSRAAFAMVLYTSTIRPISTTPAKTMTNMNEMRANSMRLLPRSSLQRAMGGILIASPS